MRFSRVRKVVGVALFAARVAAAQSPQFEVASIKPAPPDVNYSVRISGGPGWPDPGLFTCENFGLANLITMAYSLNSDQFSGPAWINDTRFNISAKVPQGATREQFNQMLQNLLAERFKLKFHHEKKEMTQQVLVIAKNGPKLKKSAPQPAESRQSISMGGEGDQVILRAVQTNMVRFAAQLSGSLHQRVTDATGLQGNFDFAMTWVAGTSAEEGGSPIFGALEKQLGLTLEKKKAMVDILVVDHIEKTPTEN